MSYAESFCNHDTAGLARQARNRNVARVNAPAGPTHAAPPNISIVIPTLNETAELPETLRRVRAIPEVCEIIVVDGGSHDATCQLAAESGCTVLTAPAGRGGQLRLGASRARCGLRLWLGGRILGDQAIFIRREVLDRIGGVPDVPLMEDVELCRRMRRVGRLALADATVVTSTRRFRKLGVLRTYWRMWTVGVRYRLGTTPEELRR